MIVRRKSSVKAANQSLKESLIKNQQQSEIVGGNLVQHESNLQSPRKDSKKESIAGAGGLKEKKGRSRMFD